MAFGDKLAKYAPIGSALGTLTVSGIAVWGVFFTSIPQTVVRQLQSEAADANERVVSLQQQTSHLSLQAERAAEELRAVQQERARAQSELQQLQRQAAALGATTKALQQQKAAYLQQVLGIVIAGYTRDVTAALKRIYMDLEEAEQYEQARLWVEREAEYQERLKKTPSGRESYALMEERAKALPDAYQRYHLDAELRDWTAYDDSVRDLLGHVTFLSLQPNAAVEAVRKRVSEVRSRLNGNTPYSYRTAAQMLLSIEPTEQGLLLEEDRAKFKAAIQAFVSKNLQQLNKPIVVLPPPRWRPEDIAILATQVRSMQRSASDALVALEQYLRLRKWD